MMKKITIVLLSAALCIFALTACGNNKNQEENQPIIQKSEKVEPTTADPAAAIEEIYSEINIKGLENADDSILTEKFAMDMDYIDKYWVKYSSKNYGVSDVFIIKPKDDNFEQVEEMLDSVKKQRISEFTNYDIYNSLQISKDAVIYSYGDYVIMLMLEDSASAKDIISKYIPS